MGRRRYSRELLLVIRFDGSRMGNAMRRKIQYEFQGLNIIKNASEIGGAGDKVTDVTLKIKYDLWA